MWSPICNASEYVEELQRCIGDALEKHGVQYTGLYADTYEPISGVLIQEVSECHQLRWQEGVDWSVEGFGTFLQVDLQVVWLVGCQDICLLS